MPRYSIHSVMNAWTSVCTELQSRTCLLHMTTPSPCFHQQIKRSDRQKKTKAKQANNQSVNINLQGWSYYAKKKIKIYFKKIIETSRASTERCCRQLLLQFLAGFKKRSNNRDVLLKFSHRREEDVQDDEEEKEEETLTH